MLKCAVELFIIILLALIPGICALFQSVSVIPRRRENITSLVNSALSTSEDKVRPPSPLSQDAGGGTTARLSPAHYLAARGGINRIEKDFDSQYGGSFFASAMIITILYL